MLLFSESAYVGFRSPMWSLPALSASARTSAWKSSCRHAGRLL